MVADGMGGAAAGEIASSMAVDVVLGELRTTWVSGGSGDAQAFANALVAATAAANERIHRYATEHPEFRGMGTTATVAGVLGDTLYIAQVGDSRAYLVRNGVARQLTKDQSLMQRLIEAGEITAEEAEVSERRNIILQALGPESTVKVDITHQQLRRGDTLVLCSDGLSGLVKDHEIADAVRRESNLTAASRHLIDLANERGGPDNITVVIAVFDGPGLAEPSSDDAVGHQSFPVDSAEPTTSPWPTSAPSPSAASPDAGSGNAAPPAADPNGAPPLRVRTSGGRPVEHTSASSGRGIRTPTLEMAPPPPSTEMRPWLPPLSRLIIALVLIVIAIVYLIARR
jgi:protein phosphatase